MAIDLDNITFDGAFDTYLMKDGAFKPMWKKEVGLAAMNQSKDGIVYYRLGADLKPLNSIPHYPRHFMDMAFDVLMSDSYEHGVVDMCEIPMDSPLWENFSDEYTWGFMKLSPTRKHFVAPKEYQSTGVGIPLKRKETRNPYQDDYWYEVLNRAVEAMGMAMTVESRVKSMSLIEQFNENVSLFKKTMGGWDNVRMKNCLKAFKSANPGCVGWLERGGLVELDEA